MATLHQSVGHSAHGEAARGDRFFLTLAMVMAATVVLGFSTQLAMGRSTFASPVRVHVHAVVFMGWVAIFVAQSWLATRGPVSLHRKLGWLALGWMAVMVPTAMLVMIAAVRNGVSPFFFQPQEFLIGNPLTLLCFVGFTIAAVALRRRTDWHARLHICGMTMIMGPAFGRMLPMPLLIPYAFEVTGIASSLFLIAGMVRDRRRSGAIHPAWWHGLGAVLFTMVAPNLIAPTAFGDWLYATTVAGHPGEGVPGMGFAPPPQGPLLIGK